MPKKSTPQTNIGHFSIDASTSHRTLRAHLQKTQQMLSEIQAKVLDSSALNGGFETLLFKIDKIEEAQVGIANKVNLIHDALYKPDDGLFARVKQTENNTNKVSVHDELVRTHDNSINELKNFKDKVAKFAKWAGATLAAAGVTLFGKLLYDFIVTHIKFI